MARSKKEEMNPDELLEIEEEIKDEKTADKKKTKKKSDEVKIEEINEVEYEELNLDQKVTIRSISGWNTGFDRIVEGIGSVTVVPGGTARISRNEIIAQVQNGNMLFNGFDGKGSHASYYIEDRPTRIEVGFESPDGNIKQKIFSEKLVKDLFDIDDQAEFEKEFMDAIVTRAEKYSVIPVMKKLGINDYSKIRFVEKYTGFKME